MSRNLPWRTGASTPRRTVVWPSPAQWIKQIVIILVVAGLWGGLFAGFLQMTGGSEAAAIDTSKPAEAVAVAPTPTPTEPPQATLTPTPEPTLPAPTGTAPLTPTVQTAAVTPTVQPAATATPTSEPSPAPTETPLPSPTSPAPAAPTEEPPAAEANPAEVSFRNDVMPIFERRCIKCHGGVNDGEERVEEGLRLTSYEEVMTGSMNGSVIEPGDVENSYLIELISNGKMPKKEPRLLPAQIRTITAWVEAGAPDN